MKRRHLHSVSDSSQAERQSSSVWSFSLCLLLGTHLAGAGEVLYNGIDLPAKWPPGRTRADILKYEPMPVPYLQNRPPVVPIDVGRQLLVDDFLVEQTTLTRRFHKAQPYSDNPILRPQKGWEVLARGYGMPEVTMAFSDGCFYDPKDKLFKIWYRSSVRMGTCYATSEDGIKWTRPAFDHLQPGSNIVQLSGSRDSSTVWLDLETTNPAERFKLYQFHYASYRPSVHTSPDGIHWSEATWGGPSKDRTTMFYNPFRKVWVFSIKNNAGTAPFQYSTKPYKPFIRARKYWESKDFVSGIKWTGGADGPDWAPHEPQYWVGADKLDGASFEGGRPELYNLDGAPYESLMLGMFTVWYSGDRANPDHPGQPKINDVMLGFSRDGYHWHRPLRESVVSVSNKPKTWNYGNVQSVGGGCLVVGDRLYMYHSGRNETQDTTGLAFFRRDGFASMEAGTGGGTLTTRPVRFSGRHLFVNLDAPQGELRVEVLDRDGKVIAPFTAANANVVRGDKTLLKIDWKGGADLSRLAGQPVRFRFHLMIGALYAFWVSPESTGASNGYIAAGGPGFTSNKDTVGTAAYEAAARLPVVR